MLFRHAFAIRRHYFTLSLPQAQPAPHSAAAFRASEADATRRAPATPMPIIAIIFAISLFHYFSFSAARYFRRSLICAISASAERLPAGADFLFAFLRHFAAIYAIFSCFSFITPFSLTLAMMPPPLLRRAFAILPFSIRHDRHAAYRRYIFITLAFRRCRLFSAISCCFHYLFRFRVFHIAFSDWPLSPPLSSPF
jgi:hypothetical protein